jgi:DNA polymerase-1
MLNEMSKQNQKTLAELTRRVYEIAGYQFNLNSTQQLGKLLFEDLGLPPVKKTKTGYSTNVTVLEKLAPDHEIAHLMLEYRQITKLESTYITALPNLINPNSGRVHTSFNQTVASTGRLSSTNPNLQNIPIRTELGREIRKAFCARDAEHVIVAADYSQIELRLLAIMSQDANMIAAFRSGADIHRQTASLVFDIMPQLVTSDQRRYAKIINFGLMYGMGAHRVSQELGISRKEAAQFIDNYFAKFPTIRTWLDAGIEQARKDGFVQTLFGRKLPLPGINSSNGMIRSEAERVATNMPIQGSAADIIKLAMIDLHEVLQGRTDILMMIQVHDELVFEVHRDALEEARQLIRKTMEGALPEEYRSIVPLVVDVGVGQNWFEAH